MAICLAQSAVDLSDERETINLLRGAGYEEDEIDHHLTSAVDDARKRRHVAALCSGLPGEMAYG
jgi:hypothetical protein